jgi:hypothetical protein
MVERGTRPARVLATARLQRRAPAAAPCPRPAHVFQCSSCRTVRRWHTIGRRPPCWQLRASQPCFASHTLVKSCAIPGAGERPRPAPGVGVRAAVRAVPQRAGVLDACPGQRVLGPRGDRVPHGCGGVPAGVRRAAAAPRAEGARDPGLPPPHCTLWHGACTECGGGGRRGVPRCAVHGLVVT